MNLEEKIKSIFNDKDEAILAKTIIVCSKDVYDIGKIITDNRNGFGIPDICIDYGKPELGHKPFIKMNSVVAERTYIFVSPINYSYYIKTTKEKEAIVPLDDKYEWPFEGVL